MVRLQVVGVRSVALSVAVALLAVTGGVPAQARDWKAKVQQVKSVPVGTVGKATSKVRTTERFTPRKVQWPAAAEGSVDLAGLAPGRLSGAGAGPVQVGVPEGARKLRAGRASVKVLDRGASESLVGLGVVAAVTGPADTPLQVSLDYSGFADAGGAGFGGRLELVSLPACALTTPDVAECQVQTPVEYTNDAAAQRLTATVMSDTPAIDAAPDPSPTASASPSASSAPSAPASPEPTSPESASPEPSASASEPAPDKAVAMGMTVLAAAAATTSDQGDFTATSLKPSAAWASGGMSGEFTWSYPVGSPQVPGGLTPGLELRYASGGTDGGVANTNNQASWVGEGFELGSAFIERRYSTCYDDRSAGNNSSSNAMDLCWVTDSAKTNDQAWDNAFLTMDGHAGELVRVANTDQWRLVIDDGTRIAKLGTVGSNNEYWRVTTPDGTQYFFGKGKSDTSSADATNSKWSVPVAANHSTEPGYKSKFADSFVSRPWRWNLDYVVAPTGATMTYYYAKETNKYKKNLATSTSYDRGGYLTRIQYGERKGAETVDDSPAKVAFTVEERCDTAISSTCKTAKPTSSTAKAWPDVPMDAVCDADYCPSQKTAPTFFSRKRLKQIDTFTRDSAGTAWQAVDTWALAGSFPKPADGGAVPSLWLASMRFPPNRRGISYKE